MLKRASAAAPAHGNCLLGNVETSGQREGGERAALADSAIRLSAALRRDPFLRLRVRMATRRVARAHARLDRQQAFEHRVQTQLSTPESLIVHRRTRTERAGRWSRGHIGAWVSSAGAWFVFLVGAVGDGSLAVAAARRDLDVPVSVSIWDITQLDSLFALTLGGVVVLTLYFLMAFGAHTLAWWVYPPSDLHAKGVDGAGPRIEFRRHIPARMYAALTFAGTAAMCWAFHRFAATRFAPAGPFAERSAAAEAFVAFSAALPALMLALAIVAANPQFVFTRKLARAHMLSTVRRRWTVRGGDLRAARYRAGFLSARRAMARVQDRIDTKGLAAVQEYVGAALASPQLSGSGFSAQRAVDVGGPTLASPTRMTGEPAYIGDFVPQLPATAGQYVAALLVEYAALPAPTESSVAQSWAELDRAADAVNDSAKGRGQTNGFAKHATNGAAEPSDNGGNGSGKRGGFVSTSGLVKQVLKGSVPLIVEPAPNARNGSSNDAKNGSSNGTRNGSSNGTKNGAKNGSVAALPTNHVVPTGIPGITVRLSGEPVIEPPTEPVTKTPAKPASKAAPKSVTPPAAAPKAAPAKPVAKAAPAKPAVKAAPAKPAVKATTEPAPAPVPAVPTPTPVPSKGSRATNGKAARRNGRRGASGSR
ncbi:MAG: hypothetical protein ACT4P1_08245 [Sporichthyaceae bacterium]